MKLRSVALVGIVCVAALGLIGVGAHAVFTTSTTSGQTITAGTGWGNTADPAAPTMSITHKNTTTTTDPTAPTASITYPVDGTTYGTDWTGTMTGTASSAASTTIASTQVAIEDTTTNQWWSGSSFSDGTQSFVPVTGNTTWMLPLGAGSLTTSDTYSVVAQATDSLGNVATSSTVSFTYRLRTTKARPTVSITYPVNHTTYGTNWSGTITGTASSNSGAGTTITATAVAIEDTATKQWWSGSSFDASSQGFVAATGTTTWMLALGTGSLTSGDSYRVVAQATDSAGNLGTSSTVTFTNTPPPTVTVTYPVNDATYGSDWTGPITGAASAGAGTTIASTQVAIEDTSATMWWNGTAFAASSQSFVAATGTTTWMLALAAQDLTAGDTYSVIAQTTDSAGNLGTSSTVTFTYTVPPTQPTVTITYPVDGTTYGADWTGTILGTASSGASTIASTQVAIEDTSATMWWNGTAFAASSQTFVAATGNTTWLLALAAENLTAGDNYSVVAQATDSAGNLGTSSTVSFTYNSTAQALGASHG